MMSFKGEHILSVKQFDRDSIRHIFQIAQSMEPYAYRKKRTTVLEGAQQSYGDGAGLSLFNFWR